MSTEKARIGLTISFVLLLVGAGFTAYDQVYGEIARPDVALKCSNPGCDYTDILSYRNWQNIAEEQFEDFMEEFPERAEQLIQEVASGRRGLREVPLIDNPELSLEERQAKRRTETVKVINEFWGTQLTNIAARCPKCSQYSLFQAQLCSNPDCQEIFFGVNSQGSFQLACPKCGEPVLGDKNE